MSGSAPVRTSYRAHRPGMDHGTKYLLCAAAALGGLLLVGMASWTLIGGHNTTVPVIEADSRPLRVKPENAGGLQVVGADDQVMGGHGATTQSMAPSAEVPAPQALRAQMQPQLPVPAAPQATAGPAAPPQVAVATPPPVAASQRPAVPAQAVHPVAPPGGGMLVQLAAVDSEPAAQAEWQRLAKRMPELLGDRRPVVQRADRDGHAIWRVRTGGFADVGDATGFCARVRAKGGACSIASF